MKTSQSFILSALAGAVVATLSVRAPAQEVVSQTPAQEVQVSQTRPSQAMLSSGVVALGVPYVTSIIVAAESNHPGDHNLYVPVAGPWMDLGDRHCAFGERCDHEGLYKGLLVVDGIFQGIGALEIVGAFLFPETVTVTSAQEDRAKLRTASFHITPMTTGSSYGLMAAGAF
jgi:hypothetical protein